ncbi:HD domain-containing protein, partial [Anaerolinea sp.]
MTLESLLNQLPESYSAADREMICKAYQLAEKAHEGQKRLSGEPYITHCEAVAAILADIRVPPTLVIAGLLHDTVEDTPITLEDIRREFGDEIAKLVDGVTKLTHLPRVSRDDQYASEVEEYGLALETTEDTRRKQLAQETLRKTFLAMGEDIRVVLIKLADRLHNMRTLGYMPENKRRRIAQETLDIFAPLANRLGIWQIKWELEDLAFRYVNPEKYKEIAELLAQKRADREKQIQEIISRLRTILEQA